jgi:hypothetical protein
MPRVSAQHILLALLLVLSSPLRGAGQAAVSVPSNDPAYGDLNALASVGLIPEFVISDRPITRIEAARMTIAAEDRLNTRETSEGWRPFASEALDRLKREFGAEISRLQSDDGDGFTRVWAGWSELNGLYLESPWRDALDSGLGGVDARLNPLVANFEGRPRVDGATLEFAAPLTGNFTDHLAIHLQPRVTLSSPRGDASSEAELQLQRAYLRGTLWNVELTVGRDEMYYGPAWNSSATASSNARPLDMIRVRNDRVLHLPWIFRYLGPTRLSFYLADLGPEQHFPNTKFYGYRFAILPWERLELGLKVNALGGGEGAPEGTFVEYLLDILIIPDIFKTEDDYDFTDKYIGFDMRLQIPEWNGMSLFWDFTMTDFDYRRVWSSLTDEAALLAGVDLPLTRDRRFATRVEGSLTGVRMYTHHYYRSGYAMEQQYLAEPSEPNSRTLAASLRWTGARNLLELKGAWDSRSNDQYFVTADANSENRTYHKGEDRPEETRARGTLAWIYRPSSRPLRIRAEAGLEAVDNFAFQEGESRTNFLLRLGFEYNPSLR